MGRRLHVISIVRPLTTNVLRWLDSWTYKLNGPNLYLTRHQTLLFHLFNVYFDCFIFLFILTVLSLDRIIESLYKTNARGQFTVDSYSYTMFIFVFELIFMSFLLSFE